MRRIILFCSAVFLLCACGGRPDRLPPLSGSAHARYFDLTSDGIVTVSPYDGHRDTLRLDRPLDNLVCLSSSYIAFLDGIGCDSVVTGVSGIGYISDPDLQERYEATRAGSAVRPLYDVGYDASPDYERIVALHPDLVLTYTVSAAESPFLAKLRSLGIPVLLLYEHLENHPLARAEYVRLFGALTGRQAVADSVFSAVCERYEALRTETARPVRVLLNIPYGDQWFIPGAESYMAALIRDAGGEVLGAEAGTAESRVVSQEEAYVLARQADAWLNPGWCRTRAQLDEALPSFARIHVPSIWNNIRRTTPSGGNDFWESGVLRPDLILSDLVEILQGTGDGALTYYQKVD